MFVFIDIWFVKQDIQKWLKTKMCIFLWRIWKRTEKRQPFFWPSGAGIRTPDFQKFSRPWFEFSWKMRVTRSNQNKLLKETGLYFCHLFCILYIDLRSWNGSICVLDVLFFCVRRCQTTQPPKSSLQKLRARRSYGPQKHWLSTQTIPNKHTKKSWNLLISRCITESTLQMNLRI